MARRKKKHEEGGDGERWAIPYADFVTLLLAFFVAMYAVSSINEGKYRVLAEALSAAFSGSPRTFEPIQVGSHEAKSNDSPMIETENQSHSGSRPIQRVSQAVDQPIRSMPYARRSAERGPANGAGTSNSRDTKARQQADSGLNGGGLTEIADKIEAAIAPLIKKDLVVVRRNRNWVEVEIKTDILFPSGVAKLSRGALPILEKLTGILAPFPNPIQIEGHTDNEPIQTRRFPSNWELSASRAASVARLMIRRDVEPERLAIIGYSKFRPVADNATASGRNQNRRVTIVILGAPDTAGQLDQDHDGADTSAAKTLATTPRVDGASQLKQGSGHAHLGSS